ncbi:G-type lectin S-receptor-like serine/threonine-protein kinase CES101 [Humulus lupulus]|uniref:G-type lectin S-receptor-like serine/threonine-protein kinase CES101 n=1 Tax=Humulus lupulus TaxID=3486 RepID=UPI002B412DC9|nr:G-type lectin S-receptor-like serine/threonine-protein kinase CES101 [Humulus lupulus]
MARLRCVIFSCLILMQSCFSSSFMFKQGQQLRASNSSDDVVSANGVFKLGFYSPGSYLSIWYRNIEKNPEVIWLGNRYPIPDPSAVFTLDFDGKLKITSKRGQLIVLNPNQNKSGNVTASLMDSGNFVLYEVSDNGTLGKVLWQSFDYPINTLLPGMKLGMNLENGQSWIVSSWLSWLALTPGAFRLGVDPGGTNQLVLWKREDVYWTSGVWKNGSFQNAPELTRRADLFEFSFVSNKEEKYFSYKARNTSTVSRLEVNFWGQIVQYVLAKDGISWENTTLVSLCKHGKEFPSLVECVKHNPSTCSSNNSEIFVPIRSYANSTKSSYMDYNTNISLIDCQATCWKNCSCIGCVTLHQNGTGCFYMTNISDVSLDERFDFGFYLESRFRSGGATNVGGTKRDSREGKKQIWWILWFIIAAITGVTVLLFGYLFYRRRRLLRLLQQTGNSESSKDEAFLQLRSQAPSINPLSGTDTLRRGRKGQDYELFSFADIIAATDNFSLANKLGEGGFGPVYKGKLPDGQEIAVKRLARHSGQGLEEFMNEITLIAELQHTNLVSLLGCCTHAEEKMLIYEYMPNKSLDFFLFDPIRRKILDWEKRVNIIEGIAQGLLYLHKYSRLRIIHRDLKASNILLDEDMNPKISDFGMARIFGRNELTANTERVVGTYGYMSPEYAMNGIFSVKSDVYSFGVLLLEIATGKKNTIGTVTLIELAWDLWNKEESFGLVDESIDLSYPKEEFMKCVRIGLLCVQELATERPTMSDVIFMLSNDVVSLPEPKQPAYCGSGKNAGSSGSDWISDTASINNVSITVMEPR